MALSQTHRFYNDFKKAVKKRTVSRMAVPVSGGLDSTLIVKALYDNGDLNTCHFTNIDSLEGRDYLHKVRLKYDFTPFMWEAPYAEGQLKEMVELWEEPYYAASINYHLFKNIKEFDLRVCMSGLGADELFGGYDYYNTDRYPRGFFEPIEAKSNEEKKRHDIHLLTYHHLRKMDKIGMHFNIESRYPFLDKEVAKYEDVGKSMIKAILSEDFDDDFINRPKQGFRAGESSKDMYLKQLSIWYKLFG